MKNIIALLSILLVAACTTTNFKQGQSLAPQKGLALFDFKCKNQVRGIFIYKSTVQPTGVLSNRSAIVDCARESGLTITKLNEGDYFIGGVHTSTYLVTARKMAYGKAYIEEQNAYKFSVKSGHVNYIGNITSKTTQKVQGAHSKIGFALKVSDKESETIEKLKKDMPSLTDTYPFINTVAKK